MGTEQGQHGTKGLSAEAKDKPGDNGAPPLAEPMTAANRILEAAVAGSHLTTGGEEAQILSGGIASNFVGLPIRELIGAPLKAAAEAQYDLSATMISYIQQVGFKKEGEKLTTNMLKFDLERPVVNEEAGTVSTAKVQVQAPLLGLAPIPALLVEDVNIDFQLEVKASNRTTDKETASGTAELKYDWYKGSLTVRGEVSASRENTRSTDHTAKYQVNVRARQQPPTDGMAKLMGLLASAVEPISIPKT
jgi:hypothetical protein